MSSYAGWTPGDARWTHLNELHLVKVDTKNENHLGGFEGAAVVEEDQWQWICVWIVCWKEPIVVFVGSFVARSSGVGVNGR